MVVALFLMTAATFAHVVMRSIFQSGLLWSLEFTGYAFAWLVLIGMAYGVRTHAHIAVTAAVRVLPPQYQKFAAILAFLLCLLYGSLMLYGSVVFVGRLFELGNAARDIPLPRWLLTAIMPAAFALFMFRIWQAGYKALRDGATFLP